MATYFVRTWKSSVLPKKQRKYVSNAPLHLRNKFIHAHLSKELRQKYGRRSFSVRAGDRVKIMRGQFTGKINKVTRVDLKNSRIYIEGIELIKKEGNKAFCPVHPSKIMLVELVLDDKKRAGSLKKGLQMMQAKNLEPKSAAKREQTSLAKPAGKAFASDSAKENPNPKNRRHAKNG